jgi:glycosyltransferase involved in cell wall biosynthesis
MNKKIVNSNCPEFGYELLSSIPYAYNLYLKGELGETVSAFDTSCLYFFSPKHTETKCQRSWDNMKKLWDTKFPNINIHRPQLDWEMFSPPPFKEYYEDKKIEFNKETVVIFNRYNEEWGEPPINYLDLNTLDILFNMLSDIYQVIYINLNKGDKYFDGAKPLELNDDEILKKYPNVFSLYDVMDMYPNLSINEIQLRIFANCSKYISSNGGQLILSAYFGGENVIFSKKCREINPKVNSFYKWYHKLGNGVFQHVDTYQDLIQLVDEKWVQNKPLINILIRTSGRPNYFSQCMKSIYNQKYKNWNVIVGIDNSESLKYTQPHKCVEIQYDYSSFLFSEPPNNTEYGIPFKYNLYLNDLQDKVNDGFVMCLDDDDELYDTDSLTKLVNSISSDDDFIMWRVKFPNRLVPSDDNFGKPPVVKDVSGIGYSYHIKNKEKWEPYKRGDYRIAKKLYNKCRNRVFLNEVITKLQRDVEDGFGRRDDIVPIDNNNIRYGKALSIIIPTFNNVPFLTECFDSIVESIKELDCEVLVGIDNCIETKKYIQSHTFDNRFKFYFFNKNVGPYVIKNTLSKLSNSDYLLFFDSDDIMTENMIGLVLSYKKTNKVIKPMYLDFVGNKNNIKYEIKKTRTYGEGVFAVSKEVFLNVNGFQGWRCAADSEFFSRLYKGNIRPFVSQNICFYRRKHPNSLTQHPDTNFSSKKRSNYTKMFSKKLVLERLLTEEYTEIIVKYHQPLNLGNNSHEIIQTSYDLVTNVINNFNPNKEIKSNVNYDLINQIINNPKIYTPTKEKPPIQNKPKNRNELTQIRKGSIADQVSKMKNPKPRPNNLTPNVFGGKKRI